MVCSKSIETEAVFTNRQKWTMNETIIFFKIRDVKKKEGMETDLFTKIEMNNE